MKISISGCARCGGDHDNLEFKQFRSWMIIEEHIIKHWAMCPESDEPLLMEAIQS